jgi:hypothetical protein
VADLELEAVELRPRTQLAGELARELGEVRVELDAALAAAAAASQARRAAVEELALLREADRARPSREGTSVALVALSATVVAGVAFAFSSCTRLLREAI